MTQTEIKKALYKEKPSAVFNGKTAGFREYNATLSNGFVVNFKIPINESNNFNDVEPAQLLIRWINN